MYVQTGCEFFSKPDNMQLLTHRETPVHSEMDRNHDVIEREEIDLFGPATYRLVTARHQLWIEERTEAVRLRHVVLSATFHQQVHVEVDHLK